MDGSVVFAMLRQCAPRWSTACPRKNGH